MKRPTRPKPALITQRSQETCDHAWFALLQTESRLLYVCSCGAERWTPLGKQRLKGGE